MGEPIRVLQVLSKMSRAGTETMIMNNYRNIDRSKVQFDFMLDQTTKGAYDDEIIALGGKIYYVPKFKIYNYLQYVMAWKKFFKEHKEHSVIHGHIGSTANIYLAMAKRLGKYVIAHSHNNKVYRGIKGIIYSVLTLRTRFIADYFMGCSEEALVSRYGERILKADNAKVFPNAIDTSVFNYSPQIRERVRKELDVEDKFVIGHVGRFCEQKNHKFLIEAFEEASKLEPKAVLLLIGEGEDINSVKRTVCDKGLTDNVIFAGVKDNVQDYMMAMDCFVLPSLYEGLGIVLLEAQAVGLPCLASSGVAKEAKISDIFEFKPLSDGAKSWAEETLKMQRGTRRSRTEDVQKAGFDIKDTAQWLENFYRTVGK